MVLEHHIVWYSEYNKYFHPHNFCIFLYVMYILQHFGRKGPSSGLLTYTLLTSTSLCLLLLLLHWPMFTLMEVEGIVCPLVFAVTNDELLNY
jgi:hypothetical protein